MKSRARQWLVLASLVALAACDGAVGPGDLGFDDNCDLFSGNLTSGGVDRDGIPALNVPLLELAEEAAFLREEDRVLGVVYEGEARAYPLLILWWHEIIKDVLGEVPVIVTYCPLTGSGLVFDGRAPDGEASLYGVSGLLFENNLMMFDRVSESLWPQLIGSARCGNRKGVSLDQIAVVETTWREWKERHPETTVVSNQTGHARAYGAYPYGDYAIVGNEGLNAPSSSFSDARPAKEPVLGVALNGASSAYPFLALSELGRSVAVNDEVGGQSIVVTWLSDSAAARAFDRSVGGQTLDFAAGESDAGMFVDDQTGSIWTADGLAVSGDLAGERLTPIDEAHVAFWFAWSVFHPDTRLGVS